MNKTFLDDYVLSTNISSSLESLDNLPLQRILNTRIFKNNVSIMAVYQLDNPSNLSFKFQNTTKDSNCLFRVFSAFLLNDESKYLSIKNIMHDTMKFTHFDECRIFYNKFYQLDLNNIIEYNKYLDRFIIYDYWGETHNIILFANIFKKKNIKIFSVNSKFNYINYDLDLNNNTLNHLISKKIINIFNCNIFDTSSEIINILHHNNDNLIYSYNSKYSLPNNHYSLIQNVNSDYLNNANTNDIDYSIKIFNDYNITNISHYTVNNIIENDNILDLQPETNINNITNTNDLNIDNTINSDIDIYKESKVKSPSTYKEILIEIEFQNIVSPYIGNNIFTNNYYYPEFDNLRINSKFEELISCNSIQFFYLLQTPEYLPVDETYPLFSYKHPFFMGKCEYGIIKLVTPCDYLNDFNKYIHLKEHYYQFITNDLSNVKCIPYHIYTNYFNTNKFYFGNISYFYSLYKKECRLCSKYSKNAIKNIYALLQNIKS